MVYTVFCQGSISYPIDSAGDGHGRPCRATGWYLALQACQTSRETHANAVKKTQYGLRALYALSRAHGGKPVLIAEMARREAIPKKFLEQILLKLNSDGLVVSKKGRGGGYSLARSPETVTLGEAIRLMEGPLAPLPCASKTAYRKCDECADDRFCGTRMVMRDVRDEMGGSSITRVWRTCAGGRTRPGATRTNPKS